jgi:two-component sensor histidine kinase
MQKIISKRIFLLFPTIMNYKIILLLLCLINLQLTIQVHAADVKKETIEQNNYTKSLQFSNQLIQYWYNGSNGYKKIKYRYDIYPVTTWTVLIEDAYTFCTKNQLNDLAFQLSIMLCSVYHDQTKFEKALPFLEQVYINKQKLTIDQLKIVLIKLEEEYRAFNYIEKAIKIRKERIKNHFINTYWEIYRDCGLIEAAKKDYLQFEPIPIKESERRLYYFTFLGELYFALNQYDSAKIIFDKGIQEANELIKAEGISEKLRMQDLNFWLGCLTGNSAKCDVARGIYTDVIPKLYFDINNSRNDIDNKIDKMIILSNVLINLKQYELAKQYLDSSSNYMIGKTIKHVRLNLYNTKSKYFKATNQLDSAVYYLELYNEYNKTLNLNLQKNQSVLLLAELEISNRRSELIASQTSNLEYIVQAKTQKQQLLVSLFSICIILAFMLGLYLNNKQKLKNKKQIEAQNIILTENTNRISTQNTKNEMLLKELHHRVKNNLQVMFSLLNIQKRRNKDEETKEILASVQNRIQTMALVHENLYNSETFDLVDIGIYIKTLVNHLHSIYKVGGKNIEISYELQNNLLLPVEKVISLGLIVNEAASNAFKYAFKHRTTGKLEISIEQHEEHIYVEINDDGPGFQANQIKETSLGIKLINIMCAQLDANYNMIDDHGILHKIVFKP